MSAPVVSIRPGPMLAVAFANEVVLVGLDDRTAQTLLFDLALAIAEAKR